MGVKNQVDYASCTEGLGVLLVCILITRETVAVPQVDVDVVPGVPGLTATHQTLPLGSWDLRVSVLPNIFLVVHLVTCDHVTFNIASV